MSPVLDCHIGRADAGLLFRARDDVASDHMRQIGWRWPSLRKGCVIDALYSFVEGLCPHKQTSKMSAKSRIDARRYCSHSTISLSLLQSIPRLNLPRRHPQPNSKLMSSSNFFSASYDGLRLHHLVPILHPKVRTSHRTLALLAACLRPVSRWDRDAIRRSKVATVVQVMNVVEAASVIVGHNHQSGMMECVES